MLAKILESLFISAAIPTADVSQKSIADNLKTAVDAIQNTIDADFKDQLSKLMPTMEDFGYPGLEGQELLTETRLDVARLLSNFTKVQYEGYNGVTLPESYNGLGFRNLLFILLQIVSFYREFRARPNAAAIHLVVIEEPEAHLHPQMQEVFIRQLDRIAKRLCEEDPDNATWPVQFIVSTHSSHVANEGCLWRRLSLRRRVAPGTLLSLPYQEVPCLRRPNRVALPGPFEWPGRQGDKPGPHHPVPRRSTATSTPAFRRLRLSERA